MPDWFYRTVAQRALFALPDSAARALALGTIGALGRNAPGRALIDLLGHMRADPRLAGEKCGVRFASRVGLGWRVDPEGRATQGLARFGAGFVEVGPVMLAPRNGPTVRRNAAAQELDAAGGARADGVARWKPRLARQGNLGVPRWIRIAAQPGATPAVAAEELAELARALAPWADAFVVENAPAGLQLPGGKPWLAAEPAGGDAPEHAAGCVISVPTRATPAAAAAEIRAARDRLGADRVLVVRGGLEPAGIEALLAAGADLVAIDAGLVFTGPGLLKRTNEHLAESAASVSTGAAASAEPAPRRAWFWGAILGGSLAAGGALTLGLALTRVLLPYDEHHLGISAEQLARLQPRLHDFMAHDRATLAGTMLGLGALYAALAAGGIRRAQHWAQVALTASALTGFASFFSFLGFGYFDPLHAYVSAVLLQFTLLALVCRAGGASPADAPDHVAERREDSAWRRGQWGQLLFVVHAAGLLIAGGVITTIGMSRVFVQTDLDFLCATPADLAAFNGRLLAVIAHDRASLGGMLLSAGLAQLLATLWGFRRGRRWLWRGLFALGLPAYGCALGIHAKVGYTDALHLAPAIVGAVLWAGGLLLTRRWLTTDAAT